MVRLNVLLLKVEEEETLLHSLLLLLLLRLEPLPRKIVMVMEYLTQVISALITQTQDALRKIRQHSNRDNLLLMGVGIRQDRKIERGGYCD